MAKVTMKDAKGKEKPLEVGTVLQSEMKGARSPLVIWKVQEVKMGKTETMTEFRLAGKDRVALSNPFTKFQLEHYGYYVLGVSDKFSPKTIKEPDEKLVVELVDVSTKDGANHAIPVVSKVGKDGRKTVLEGPTKPEHGDTPKTPNPGPEKGAKGQPEAKNKPGLDKPNLMGLLEAWAFGVEPENIEEIKTTLKGAGVNTKRLSDEIMVLLEHEADRALGGGS